jgi:hypothetical protein
MVDYCVNHIVYSCDTEEEALNKIERLLLSKRNNFSIRIVYSHL